MLFSFSDVHMLSTCFMHCCYRHGVHPWLGFAPFILFLVFLWSTVLIWVSLQSIEDWIQDFKQFLKDAPYSTVLEDMYPDAHVHHGFLQQLQAVTDKAPNTTQNIGDVLMEMSGGVPPSLVIVTGWSLLHQAA